jgi:hypothetical protein
MDIEERKIQKLFETSSFPLASYLIYLGFNLWGIKNDKRKRKKIFVFERNDNLEQVLETYWRKLARVEPESFWLAEKILKSRLYDESK